MSVIVHTGRQIPPFRELWSVRDEDWLWVSWANVLNGATIQNSEWVLPDGWSRLHTRASQTVTDTMGESHTGCNGVLLGAPDMPGRHVIGNRVMLSDGRIYERSAAVYLQVI